MGIKIGALQLENDISLNELVHTLQTQSTQLISQDIQNNIYQNLQNETDNFLAAASNFFNQNTQFINNYIANQTKLNPPDYLAFHHLCVSYQKKIWTFLGKILYTIVIKDDNTAYLIDEAELTEQQMSDLFTIGIHRNQASVRYSTSKQTYTALSQTEKMLKIKLPVTSFLSKVKKIDNPTTTTNKYKLGRSYFTSNMGYIDEFALALTLQQIFLSNKSLSTWQKAKIAHNVNYVAGRLQGDIQIDNSQVEFAVKSVRNSAASIGSDKDIVDLAKSIQSVIRQGPVALRQKLQEILQADLTKGQTSAIYRSSAKKMITNLVDKSQKL